MSGGDNIKGIKAIMIFALIAAMLCLMSNGAYAVSTAKLFGDEIQASVGETVMIPIKITNNKGVMGFKITVEYDTAVLNSPMVSRGTLTQNGNFNDSIGVTPNGQFDIVWSDIKDSDGDGSVAVLSFVNLLGEGNETQIKLSFSQPDTFNEKWEDVAFECAEIKIKCTEKAKPVNDNKLPKGEGLSDAEIKNAVEIVLNENGIESLSEIKENEAEAFVSRANDVAGQLKSAEGKYFESFEALKNSYNDAVAKEFISNSKKAVNSDVISRVIGEALTSVNAESIDKIKAEDKKKFVEIVENGIAQQAPDVDGISKKLSADEAVKAIERLGNENAKEATNGKKVPKPESGRNAIAIKAVIAAAVIVTAAAAVIVLYRKQKCKKSEEEK